MGSDELVAPRANIDRGGVWAAKLRWLWHASFSIAAGVLYFFFVLPRWPELTGRHRHTLGTVLRIVTGALIGLAALPVVFTLLRTRKPEFGTPQLALSLRTSSIGLHVLAGVLIIGAAISEIWLSLDSAGRWLFGIYGAAAAIALLGILAFYLAFVAELPPPPPKPLKPKAEKHRAAAGAARPQTPTDDGRRGRRRRRRGRRADDDEPSEAEAPAESEDQPSESLPRSRRRPPRIDAPTAETDTEPTTAGAVNGSESTNGRLRNRRPGGQDQLAQAQAVTRRRRRRRLASRRQGNQSLPRCNEKPFPAESLHMPRLHLYRLLIALAAVMALVAPIRPAIASAAPSGHRDRGRSNRPWCRSTPRSTTSTPSVRAPASCSTPTARC